MTVAEFIVETQWTLLILLFLISFVLAMICGRNFRAAVLSRTWRVGPDGLTSEAPNTDTTEALQAATATDEQIAQALTEDGEEEPPAPAEITTYRREAVEALVREAALWGWSQAAQGASRIPETPHIDWESDNGPRVQWVLTATPRRGRTHSRWPHNLATAEAIRNARRRAGLAQSQVAQRVGVDPAEIARIEQGKLSPSAHELRRIAEALGVPLMDLIAPKPPGGDRQDDTPAAR